MSYRDVAREAAARKIDTRTLSKAELTEKILQFEGRKPAPKPEPQSPVSRVLMDQGAALARKYGLKFTGVGDGAMRFTDPVSKKPVEIKPGEDVPAKLKSLRVVPGDSATPTGGGSKYGRSEPARPNPTRDEGKIKQEFSRRAVEQKLHEWLTQNDAETGRPDKFTPTTIHGAEGEPPTVIERPVLPKDALDGLPPVEKARLSKFVDEDAWSAITQHMNARQMDALQGEMMSRAGETKGTRLERAMETAKKSGDPRAKFLAAYLENAPPMGEQVPKEWLDAGSLTENDVGKTFEIHGEKFRVDVGDDGNLILKDHITIENPESLGKIPVDKGTVKEPEEAELGDEPFNPDEEKPNPRKDIPGELLLESHNISEYKPDEAVQKRGNKWGYKHISGTNNQSMFRTKAEAVLAAEKHREFMREQLEEKIDALPERKTTGPQGSLLGERYEGSGIGSKTGSMFGDTSRGAASKLEESAPASALEKKFADTKSGELFNPGESLPSERGAGNALNAQGGDKPAESATPSPETGRIGSPEKPKVERDEYQRNEIRNSIAEGELILRTGKFHGKPRTESQLTAVRKSVDNAYEKLGETPPMQVGDKFPFPGSKPKDKFPVVTDVRLTPEGKRQYQVRFGEKTDAQWMPTPRPLADAELGNPPAPKASDVVDPENESGLGEKSIGAAEDAAATARKLAQQSKGKSFLDYAAEGMKKTAGLPMKVLRNFRERLNFLNTEYGKAGTELVKPMSEYLGSRQHADYAGTSETGRVFKGLSDEQKSEFVALGLDGRRRIENMGVAEKFAQAMFPRKKGEVANKLSGGGLHDAVARAIAAALDHGQSYDHATLGAGIAGKLHDINPDLVTRWANMAAERPEFTPEAMAREESRRALELMKFDEDGRNRILGNKSILDAIERWKTGVEPALMELRARNGMPIDKHWNAVPLALNFVQKPSGRAFTPSPGIRERNPFTFNGEGREKQTDPNLFLSKIIAQHLTADREKSLLAAIRNSALVVPEKKVYVAESGANRGREVAIVQGNETPVQKYDVARNAAQPEEIYLPQKLVKELDTLNRVDRPDNSTKIGGWIIGIGLQGKAAFHAMSALMNASATISAKGPGRWENIVPWLGSRAGTAVRGVRDAFSPVGDMHQMLLNDLEASGNRGIGSVHNERTYSQIAGEYMAGREKLGQTAKEVLTKFAGLGHDVLFKPKVGAENIMRAQLLDSFMQVATGEWYTRLKSDVRAGKVSPLRAAEMIRKVLPPADYQKAQRFINDTLGWMDPNARSVSMNRAQKIFPFLGTEASTIPGSIKRLFTANVDFAGIGKALGAKDFKGAGIKAAQGLLGGPVGLFAFANLLNYAINGRLMSDNDADHKHEVHLGGGWYWGLDSQLQRAARLTGMQGIVNKRPAATVKEIAGHWANEGQSILHPAIGSLWDLAMALSGGKSLYSGRSGVFFSPKLNDAWTSLVPYFSNTAASIAAGKGAGEGLAKDVAGTLGQSVRRDDGDLSKVLEHASAEEAVSLYKQASPEQRKVIGSAVRMKIARSNQKSDLYQQIK